jgi:cell division protein FtsW (lipid II flippase)
MRVASGRTIPLVLVSGICLWVAPQLALLLLFLYLLLLPLGYLASAAAIGEWLLSRTQGGAQLLTRQRILMLIGVLSALFVLTRIPVLGAVLRFLLILAGIGSLVMASALRHRGETAAAMTT